MSIGLTDGFDVMADKGHFTWEAVIALALFGMVLTSVQIVTLGSLGRVERSRALYSEALALERIQLCVSRIGFVADIPETCAKSFQATETTSGTLKLYAIKPGALNGQPVLEQGREITFLRLEFAE